VPRGGSRTRLSTAARDGCASGCGFDVDQALAVRRGGADAHLGLPALVERARVAGGDARIRSAAGRGTVVTFWLPNRPSAPAILAGSPVPAATHA
jgi:nitrate/nitrite-specific signal transduction histidine kinase